MSPLIRDPLPSRLSLIEILTLMSDYRTAYHMAHTLMDDIKTADSIKALSMTPQDTLRTIAILLYLMEKLKMRQQMIDFYESFITNEDVMSRCNPIALYYLIEHARHNPKLVSIFKY